MTQQQAAPACHVSLSVFQRDQLLARYPVALPLILLAGAAGLVLTSFFGGSLFPVLALFGISAAPIYLALALVPGIAGILAGIISILECSDSHHLRSTSGSKQKGA